MTIEIIIDPALQQQGLSSDGMHDPFDQTFPSFSGPWVFGATNDSLPDGVNRIDLDNDGQTDWIIVGPTDTNDDTIIIWSRDYIRDLQSFDRDSSFFASIGFSVGLSGGLFYSNPTGLGMYSGLATPGPSATFGVTNDANAYLTGWGIEGQATPLIGGGVSPGSNAGAVTFGIPGLAITNGMTFQDIFNQLDEALRQASDAFINRIGYPDPDAPPPVGPGPE